MKKILLATAAVIIAAASSQVQAYDRDTILLGLGADNLRGSDEAKNDTAAEANVEMRFSQFNNLWGINGISPLVGAEVDTRGASYFYGGLLYDWNFYDRWHLVPNEAFGAYFHGDGKDLGGIFEFHDSIELDYQVDVGSRIGLDFTHISNAGIYSHNPGKEDLMLNYQIGL